MLRTLVRLAALLTAGFALAAGAVRLRPYEDAGLRALLTTRACEPPCFMDIPLGKARASAAIDLLDGHPWVDHVIVSERFGATNRGFLSWAWNGAQPAWIDTQTEATLWVRDQVVRFVRVQTRIRFGDLWLAVGPPAKGSFRVEGEFLTYKPIIVHHAVFPQLGFTAQFTSPCPYRATAFWNEPVELQFYATLSESFTDYDLRAWLRDLSC